MRKKTVQLASIVLLAYVKRTSQQQLFIHSLKQSCETRLNSNYFMLKSVEDQFDNIQAMIKENSPAESRRLAAIDLTELIAFLKVSHLLIFIFVYNFSYS